jgi:hypothetical protein
VSTARLAKLEDVYCLFDFAVWKKGTAVICQVYRTVQSLSLLKGRRGHVESLCVSHISAFETVEIFIKSGLNFMLLDAAQKP